MSHTITSKDTDLDSFLRSAKNAAVPDATLVALLEQRGWSARRVYERLGAYYENTLGFAIPARAGAGENARDAFLYLLNFLTLAVWTIGLGSLLYVIIGRALPDPADRHFITEMSLIHEISWQMASVIVAFPLFCLLDRILARELARRPEFSRSGVRAWLTYIALVIAAAIVLGDGITFLATFLGGGLSTRFVLDSLVLMILTGGVFGYYLRAMVARPKATA